MSESTASQREPTASQREPTASQREPTASQSGSARSESTASGSESNAPGCLAIFAILGALMLTTATAVYGVAALRHEVRSPPPPAGADVTEAQALGLAPDQPPIGEGVAFADLQVNCKKKKGRVTETTLLAHRVYGSPKLATPTPPTGKPPELPSFDFEIWTGYETAHADVRRLEGHPTEPLVPDWKQYPCDTYQVFVARVLPGQHVMLKDGHAWFGTREELQAKAADTQRGIRDQALLFGGLALLLWIVGLIAGRKLWAQRHREDGGR